MTLEGNLSRWPSPSRSISCLTKFHKWTWSCPKCAWSCCCRHLVVGQSNDWLVRTCFLGLSRFQSLRRQNHYFSTVKGLRSVITYNIWPDWIGLPWIWFCESEITREIGIFAMVAGGGERKYRELLLVTCQQTDLSHTVRIAKICPDCGYFLNDMDGLGNTGRRSRSPTKHGAISRSRSTWLWVTWNLFVNQWTN